MRINNIIENIDDIRQERPNENPNLKLNKSLQQNKKSLLLNKNFMNYIKKSMIF